MKSKIQLWTGFFAAIAMLFLILDTKTALEGAKEGIDLCIYSVIPALFPFIILSGIVCDTFIGRTIPFLKPLCRLCGIPTGTESLLILGFLGGYPAGAQSIHQAYTANQLSKTDAQRMLGFCNNAGPAFIFGMLGPFFNSAITPWILWLIHILSALAVSVILPKTQAKNVLLFSSKTPSISATLIRSVRITANVCAWVFLFRIIIQFAKRWFLWLLPTAFQTVFCGLLELTNGCVMLSYIQSESLRFIFASCFLAFGGFCVIMQTNSVVKDLGIGTFIQGKLLQLNISFLLAAIIQRFFITVGDTKEIEKHVITLACLILITCVFYVRRKKLVAFLSRLMYNNKKQTCT